MTHRAMDLLHGCAASQLYSQFTAPLVFQPQAQ